MKKYFFTVSLLLLTQFITAQVDPKSDLYKTIMSKDSLLFTIGFNTCDIAQFENLLSDEFKFFHDKDGISDKKQFLTSLRNGLCASPDSYQSRRELISGSTEIFPLYKNNVLYGAIQKGNHRFYETIPPSKEAYAGSARFSNVWLLENGIWKLSECLSYDHQNTDFSDDSNSIFTNEVSIEKWLKENKIPTLGVGIINNGKLQQIKVYGELQPGVSAPYNTVFNVASLAKPVTAMVALRLTSMNKWDLDEPLYHYWVDPDVSKDKNHKNLTTRHILSHQSGFPNWRWESKSGKLEFQFIPGTQYQYSGEGFEYLRKALEKKFNKNLNDLALELLFEPLNMTDTKFVWDENKYASRFAIGYNIEGKPYKTIKNKTPNAADDLLTTIEDYSNFMISILNGSLLSEPIYKEMTTPKIKVNDNKYFGLGFVIYDLGNDEYAISHSGGDDGCQTLAVVFPKTKQGIIIFTNVDDGYKVYEPLLSNYFGEKGKRILAIEKQ